VFTSSEQVVFSLQVWFPIICTENPCLHLPPLLTSLPIWIILSEDRCERTVQDLHQIRREIKNYLLTKNMILYSNRRRFGLTPQTLPHFRLLCCKQISLESCTECPCRQDKRTFRHW